MPGAGKTHALCAIGHRLVESGRSVIFAPAYRLVQDLLAAKRDLALPRQLCKHRRWRRQPFPRSQMKAGHQGG